MVLVLALLVTLGLWSTAAGAAAPDQQEDICTSPAVIFCENFEDRSTTNPTDMYRAKYKNKGWGLSQPGINNYVVADGNHIDGTKAFRFDYVQGYNTGGAGFLETISWGGTHYELYARVYTKWSTNYIQSHISTKHFEFSGMNGMWANANGARELIMNIVGWTGVTLYLQTQNVKPAFAIPTDGSWHCFEVHWKHNALNQSDGIIEGWIDGVQKWSYTNLVIVPPAQYAGSANLATLMMASYWNCSGPSGADGNGNCPDQVPADFHPAMQRWHDNIVVSTQRIGCLGSATPGTAPNPPGPPTLSSLRAWLASLTESMWSVVGLAASHCAPMWYPYSTWTKLRRPIAGM
jgi:hypothetical protein